jgi:hypothetical protein
VFSLAIPLCIFGCCETQSRYELRQNSFCLRRNASGADALTITRYHRCRRRTTNAEPRPRAAEDVAFLFHIYYHRTAVNEPAHAMRFLLRFLLSSGRYYKGDSHKSEKD